MLIIMNFFTYIVLRHKIMKIDVLNNENQYKRNSFYANTNID